jgi:hypothetical protein
MKVIDKVDTWAGEPGRSLVAVRIVELVGVRIVHHLKKFDKSLV